tara:strand:- start:671 stop:1600 length:930 start_codon:yes stop_codon:yes gene_type:complete
LATKQIVLLLGSNGFLGTRVKKIFKNKKCLFLDPDRKILDLKKIQKINIFLKKNRVTHIINCAGKVGGILDNSRNQIDFYRENNEINYNLISSSFDLGIRNFLNLSSSCMYPNNFDSKINENKIMTGKLESTNFGYAMAKLSAASYIKLIRDKYHYNYSNIIPCNLYGPNDKFDKDKSHLIASIIRKVSKAKKNMDKSIEVWGDGSPKREFLYVDDLANFIFSSIKKNYFLPTYLNIGYGKDYTVTQYYKKVMKLYKYKVKLTYDLKKPNGIKRKLLDISLAKKDFKFYPSTNLNTGLIKTIKYYENSI